MIPPSHTSEKTFRAGGAAGTDEGLAVVIPAFKGGHLREALAAFAAQTSRRFRLYVADDASPENLEAIVRPFARELDLVYRRFDRNLGGTSLASHWDRAIALSDERWVWLFSDDDEVSPDCVAAFWAARVQRPESGGLHRFQCQFVGPDGKALPQVTLYRYPPQASWEEHVRAITMTHPQYVTIVQNVIFPRELYQRHGGFADYPLGLWSDYITWARWSYEEGFFTMPTGTVFYRIHPSSIGGQIFCAGGGRTELLRTAGRMLVELHAMFAERGRRAPDWALLIWMSQLFQYAPAPLSLDERAAAAECLRLGWPRWPLIREVVFWFYAGRPALRRSRWAQWLLRWKRRFRAN